MKLNFSTIISVALLACVGIDAKLTDSQKNTLLSLHQKARASLNASDMKSISWDSSLASAAQDYSELCKGMVHSGEGPENLAGSTTGDVSRMFNNWMSEKSGFDASGFRANFKGISYGGEDIGHYSQIVWADNTKVGCGLTYCENFSAKYLLVCRYGTGNILNQEVYALGSSSDNDSDSKKTTTTSKTHTTTTTTVKRTTTTTTVRHTTTTTTIHRTTTTTTSEPKKTTTVEEVKKTTTINAPVITVTTGLPVTKTDVPVATTQTNPLPTINANNTIINDDKNQPKSDNDNVALPGEADNNDIDDGKNDINNNKNNNNNNNEGNTENKDNKNGVVETKNINDNYEKDGIVDEVGPSGYKDSNTGTYVTGIAVTGSVVGAAAAFVFLKKNPKQYQQLAKNMKTIQRGISRRATTVKRGATNVTRKMSLKKPVKKSPANSLPSSTDSSQYNMYELPTENYRYQFTQNFDF